MANSNEYTNGQTQLHFLQSLEVVEELSNSSNITDLYNLDPTYGLNSSESLLSDIDNVFIDGLENFFEDIDTYLSPLSAEYSVPDLTNVGLTETQTHQYENETLQIIAEPKAFYRGRYSSEISKQKNPVQRFIRSESKNPKYMYPTVKIPTQWCQSNRQLYIRVTLVTVISSTVSQHYIHPYQISTSDNSAIENSLENSLYFRINEKEINTGERSIHLIVEKKKKDELKSYGPMRLFNQHVNQHFQQTNDPKDIIDTYQLKKSQLVFTIAERFDNNPIPVPIPHTSVISQIMTDIANDTQKSFMIHAADTFIGTIQCIPQKADWTGGDQILIIMPYLIKQKEYSVVFDFGSCGKLSAYDIKPFDRKILSFRAPPCPLLPRNEDVKVSIIITENNVTFPPIDFYYITPMQRIMYICSRCQGSVMNNGSSYKRRCEYDSVFENDSGDHLVSQMNQLSLEKKSSPTHSQISSNNNDVKLEKLQKYLDQLKDALQIFIRTNDPSQLFRRTRILLSKCDGNESPLNNAIENGHVELALSVIKQTIDANPSIGLLEKVNEHGESALLIASKCNEWKVIEIIVRKRCDLAEQ
ncbi:unnamed protein product, partial [Adineta steineri]